MSIQPSDHPDLATPCNLCNLLPSLVRRDHACKSHHMGTANNIIHLPAKGRPRSAKRPSRGSRNRDYSDGEEPI